MENISNSKCEITSSNLFVIQGTIRRFLEQYGDSIESVILVLDANNYGIYQVLSPLYFPRSVQEAEFSRYQLPFEIGDPVNGEPIISDRRIRIIDNPQHAFQGKNYISALLDVALHENAVNLILVTKKKKKGLEYKRNSSVPIPFTTNPLDFIAQYYTKGQPLLFSKGNFFFCVCVCDRKTFYRLFCKRIQRRILTPGAR